jgi:tetratricopeptide (TPR) repeat protein
MSLKELIKTLRFSKLEDDRRECIRLIGEYLQDHDDDVEAWFSLAICLDFLGYEEEAELNYRKVDTLGAEKLPIEHQASFYLGYGSTLRNNGQLEESKDILEEGVLKFADQPALKVFLALTLHSSEMFREASEILLEVCVQLPEGNFNGFEKAIKYYFENL